MIKRCPVHGPARSRAVLVLLGGYDNSFQAEVVLAQESLVPCQILADDDGLGVGDESEAGDADRVFTAGTLLIVNRPLSSATAHCSHSTATTVANSTGVLVLLFTTVPEMV